MTIGAVIVTHNSKKYITKCIKSLAREGVQDIIVVDSASIDNTLQEAANCNVRTTKLHENKGFGHAANRGVQELNTDYVLFINPDAWLMPGAIQEVIRVLTDTENLGVLGILLQDANGNIETSSFGQEPDIKNLLIRKFLSKSNKNKPVGTDWVSGGAMVVNRELFARLHGFDEDFFLYWEDIDLCKRIRQAGYTVYFSPNSRASHLRGASNVDKAIKTHMYDASADRYYKKHYPTHIWILQRILRNIYRIVRPRVY